MVQRALGEECALTGLFPPLTLSAASTDALFSLKLAKGSCFLERRACPLAQVTPSLARGRKETAPSWSWPALALS